MLLILSIMVTLSRGAVSGCVRNREHFDMSLLSPEGLTEIPVDRVPWMVSLVHRNYPDKHFCGGVLLSSDQVLTTAGCLLYKTADDISVLVGVQNVAQGAGQEINVTDAVSQPDYEYDPWSLFGIADHSNDFAILKLAEPAPAFNDQISQICIPSHDQQGFDSDDLFTCGWSQTDSSEAEQRAGQVLRGQRMFMNTTDECLKTRIGHYPESMICAEGRGADFCQVAVSGNPLVAVTDGGKFTLIGLSSWGYSCQNQHFPDEYGRVDSVRDFIMQNVHGVCQTDE